MTSDSGVDPPRRISLEEQLEQILTDKQLRINLAEKGRQYVEKYCFLAPSGEYILNLLASEDNSAYYPRYFVDDYVNVYLEPIPEYLQLMTIELLQKYGLHPESAPKRPMCADLIPKLPDAFFQQLKRWDTTSLVEDRRWVVYKKDWFP